MGSVTIRNLDDDIIDSFRTKAELNGRSLEAELRAALADSAPLTPAQRVALADRIRSMSPYRHEDSTHLIREDRDSR